MSDNPVFSEKSFKVNPQDLTEKPMTLNGTIIKTTRENFVCNDWDNFKDYIKQHDALELLQQRIHQANFKEFIANKTEEGLPPGISALRELSVVVRKPSKQ